MPSPSQTARRRAIWERDRGICELCGQPVPIDVMHLDHIKPVSLGGASTDDNLRPTHPRCNIGRGNGRVPRTVPLKGRPGRIIRFPAGMEQEIEGVARKERRTFTAQVILMVERQLALSAAPASSGGEG